MFNTYKFNQLLIKKILNICIQNMNRLLDLNYCIVMGITGNLERI